MIPECLESPYYCFKVIIGYGMMELQFPECNRSFLVQPQHCSGLTMCCVTATGRLCVDSAGKRGTHSDTQTMQAAQPGPAAETEM